MTDRDLLELAARAAGLSINLARQAERDASIGRDGASLWIDSTSTAWNPLGDGGHALKLAVTLGLEIRQVHGAAHAGRQGQFWRTEHYSKHSGDKLAATRRAITHAAAVLAAALPDN